MLLKRIQEEHLPCVLCINKIDTVERKDALLEVIAAYSEAYDGFDAIIPISARTETGWTTCCTSWKNTPRRGRSCSPTA